MKASNGGSGVRLKNRPTAINEGFQPVVKMRSFFWRLPSAAAKPASGTDDDSGWPPGVMLIFAGCLSFILWAGIIAAIIWTHRAWGWF